ncbi:MAG: hypothetical protein RBS39_02330 [Phycisphaerales bacterium]|jgi:hypothetical protein|nr:hypothetical protein [Phycisphaerales bacterium]
MDVDYPPFTGSWAMDRRPVIMINTFNGSYNGSCLDGMGNPVNPWGLTWWWQDLGDDDKQRTSCAGSSNILDDTFGMSVTGLNPGTGNGVPDAMDVLLRALER